MAAAKRSKVVSYTKWGYIFLIPFFLVYTVFSLVPLISTVYYSFFERYMAMGGLTQVGPNFIGIQNYITILTGGGKSPELYKYAWNTLIMWLMGFIPQIVIALILASWFSDSHLITHGKQAFKVIIYLPNMIMASAFAMLFFTLFSDSGPVNSLLMQMGVIREPIRFMRSIWGTRSLIASMNFLMWFGNTTIMLMAAIMGISPDLFEAAQLDGAGRVKMFFYITLPLIRPILTYTLIVSLIGGLQMFDVPQILTNGQGTPNRTSMTLIMLLNNYLKAPDYGMSGALSVYLFVLSGILCFFVNRIMQGTEANESKARKKRLKRERRIATGEERSAD